MNCAEVATHKALLRVELLAARRALTDPQRDLFTSRIGTQIVDWIAHHAIRTLAVYSPLNGEPDLRPTWSALAASGVALALPVVVATDAPLDFVAWQPGEAMTRDAFGAAIPTQPHRHVAPDAILIPCLGITPQRIRLGYGGGFYDRTLALMRSVPAIGVAFDCGKTAFEAQAHDIALQAVMTESGIF